MIQDTARIETPMNWFTQWAMESGCVIIKSKKTNSMKKFNLLGDDISDFSPKPIDIFLWMDDFDNSELSDYERSEQLRDAVIAYNERHNTQHNPDSMVRQYFRG